MTIFSQGTNRHCYSKACTFSKKGKLTPWFKNSATFLLPQVFNSIMHTCIRLKQLPHLYKQPHGSSSTPPTRPFTCLLTKLGTCTPTHENTPSAHAHPKQEHEHSHFTSWEKQPVREGHRLYTSKNVRWFVGSSPSHFDFLQQTFDCD